MKTALRKLNNRSGFTLAELLVTILILLMVSAVVAGGIPAASNAYSKAVDAANAQVLLSTAATALRDELGTAQDVSVNGTAVSYYSADTGNFSTLSLAELDGRSTVQLTTYAGDEVDGETIGSDGNAVSWPLVSSATITKKLSLSYESVSYEKGLITFGGLTVSKGNTTLASLDELIINVISAT